MGYEPGEAGRGIGSPTVRNALLGSLASLLVGAGLTHAQFAPAWAQGGQPPVYGPYPSSAYGFSAPARAVPVQDQTAVPQTATPAEEPADPATPPPATPGDVFVPGQPLPAAPYVPEGDDYRPSRDGDTYGPGPCPYRIWASAEYLLWWVKPGIGSTPLATTGPPASAGILGNPGTTVLLGNSEFDFGDHSGIRGTVGFWFDREGHVGAELTGFALGEKSVNRSVISDANGSMLIGRPIINALTGQEASFLLASPGQLAGGITVGASNQLYGAEVNFVGSLFRTRCFTADMIIGFRYLGLDEKLDINSSTTVLAGGVAAFNGNLVDTGNTITILDHFDTRNDFYGGQIGGRAEFRKARFFVDLEGKLAVGNAHEVVNASGASTLSGPAGVSLLPGGLLAVSSNSGVMSRDEFTFVPEGSARLGLHITNYVSVFVGYTFLYWFDVARPTDQIDRTVNPTLVPANLSFGSTMGPARPAVNFQKTDFWAQGISFGFEVRY